MVTHKTAKERGAKTQALVAEYYRRLWPAANSQGGGAAGRDVRDVPVDIEVKARRDFDPMAWIKQGRKRARPATDVLPPHVVMRPQGVGEHEEAVGEYLVIRYLRDDTDILAELLMLRRRVAELGGLPETQEAASA